MKEYRGVGKCRLVIICIIFLIMSFLYIDAGYYRMDDGLRASSLKRIVTYNNNQKRTDYVDSNGKITRAVDLGYATKIETQNNNSLEEQYFDESFEPTKNAFNCYGVKREYDEKGDNYLNVFLNIDGNPMINNAGYAMEIREFDESGNIVKEKYYGIEGEPINTFANAFGRLYEYDENGNAYKIKYINEKEEPMLISSGYAMIVRSFYPMDSLQKGRVDNEFYYDTNGNPVSLSLGQYGLHKEYDDNGQISLLIYLNIYGNPMVTNKGYSSVRRTYYTDNTIATELYYDLYNKPVILSEGQYGIEYINGAEITLDQEGKIKFGFKNILYAYPGIVIVFAIGIVILSQIFTRNWNIALLAICLCIIIYLTLMCRSVENAQNVGLLSNYKKILYSKETRADITRNIWLFIPLGAILYRLYPRRIILLIPMALSLLIEGIQFSAKLGFCELDDVISNGFGGWMGFSAGELTKDLLLRIKNWNQSEFT